MLGSLGLLVEGVYEYGKEGLLVGKCWVKGKSEWWAGKHQGVGIQATIVLLCTSHLRR